jgi:hypothetical protein
MGTDPATPSQLPAANPAPGHSRRNYVLGTLNGIVGAVSMDFIHPELILAGLVMALTGSYWLVALVTIINKAGSLVPQLQVGAYVEHKPRKRPFYVALTLVRLAAAAVLLVAIHSMPAGAAWTLAAFFAAYLVWCVCGGAGHVIFLDMVGRLIPLRRVGTFFGTREFWGGILSLVAGWLIIQPILDSNRGLVAREAAPRPTAPSPPDAYDPHAGAPAPSAASSVAARRVADPLVRTRVADNYLLLAAVGGALSVLAMTLLAASREEPGPRARRPTTLRESLRRGFRWLREDPDYRAYFWLRISFRITYLALAFFIPFGVARLRYTAHPLGVVALGGIMLATIKGSRVLASALWGRVVDRLGDRACLVAAGSLFSLGPALMLLAPVLPHAFSLRVPFTDAVLDLPLAAYLVALAVVGAAFQASIIGGNRFLIGHAPPHRRISYVGFLNTVTSPLTLLPALGALVAQTLGVTALYVGIAGGGILFLVWALRLSPDRPDTETPDTETPEPGA